MTKVRVLNQHCATEFEPCVSDSQAPIQFQDEGVNLGEDANIDIINFVGAAVTAVRSGNTLTITITGGGTSFEIVEYTDFETLGLPTVAQGYIARLVFVDEGFTQVIDDVQYYHNKIIYFDGTNWISWSADYGAST